MKKASVILIFLANVFSARAQNGSTVNFSEMNYEQIMNYVNEGHNLNRPYGEDPDFKSTEFKAMFWGYGYWCMDSLQPAIYRAVEIAKEPINDPLYFLNDPCGGRSKDILEYFSLLVKYKHGVTESDFHLIQKTYYYGWQDTASTTEQLNRVDKNGKTMLMYACEFGYVQSVKTLLNAKADVSIKDKFGKTAYDYAKNNGNTELISLIKTAMPSVKEEPVKMKSKKKKKK